MFRLMGRLGKVLVAALAAASTVYGSNGLAEARDDKHQSSPAQIGLPCPTEIIPIDSLVVIAPVPMSDSPLILANSIKSLPLTAPENRETTQLLAGTAQIETKTVLLQLRCVEADRNPGAMWEVYVGLPPNVEPSAEGPYFVGTLALFGDGIKGDGHHPAEFTFPLNRAIAASVDKSALTVTFVPSSGVVVNGLPMPAEVKAQVRIGEVNLLLEGPSTRPQ